MTNSVVVAALSSAPTPSIVIGDHDERQVTLMSLRQYDNLLSETGHLASSAARVTVANAIDILTGQDTFRLGTPLGVFPVAYGVSSNDVAGIVLAAIQNAYYRSASLGLAYTMEVGSELAEKSATRHMNLMMSLERVLVNIQDVYEGFLASGMPFAVAKA